MHPTNDPTNYDNLTHLKAADHDILNVETEQNATIDDTATEQAEKIGKRRSGRIKGRTSLERISKLRVNKVRISQAMGQPCSVQLKEAQEENKILKARVHLYENGVSDQSIHASQTNIGLFNLASEENEECSCANGSSGGGVVTIIEAIAIMIISILVLYIIYCCCIKFNARRKAEKEKSREKRRTFIMK